MLRFVGVAGGFFQFAERERRDASGLRVLERRLGVGPDARQHLRITALAQPLQVDHAPRGQELRIVRQHLQGPVDLAQGFGIFPLRAQLFHSGQEVRRRFHQLAVGLLRSGRPGRDRVLDRLNSLSGLLEVLLIAMDESLHVCRFRLLFR